MSKQKRLAVALTIAGSDSGGGAGIQADLKTFGAIGVHGTSTITCVTAQNPRAVIGIEPCSPRMVQRQMEAVFAELPPAAIKTGMLYSEQIIRAVAKYLSSRRGVPLVVDPVMISTSGARLLQEGAVRALKTKLLPLTTLVTPNLDEAAALVGRRLRSVEDMRLAAHELHERYGCAVLVKGGHLKGTREAADILFDGREELLLTAPFIKGVHTHGTGCTYSAAIVAYLGLGHGLVKSVMLAKEFITQAIAQHNQVKSSSVLNCFWK